MSDHCVQVVLCLYCSSGATQWNNPHFQVTEAVETRLVRAVAAMGNKIKFEVEMIESRLAEYYHLFAVCH